MRNIFGLIALGLSFIASPLAAQTTASSGQGVQLNQEITDSLTGATVRANVNTPRAAAAFPGGPASDSQPIASVNETITLGAFGVGLSERLTTGVIETSAVASATQATGTATVNNLAFSLGTGDISLLSITATTVQSTSTATVSPLDAMGTTTISNLQLTGSLFGPSGTLTLTAEQQAALDAGTPNIEIFNAGGVKITLNQQAETTTTNADGSTTLAIKTNAIAVQFTNVPVGTTTKNGELLIASSSASVTTQAISPM